MKKYERPTITPEMNEKSRALAMEVLANGTKCGIKTDPKKAREHIDKFYRTVLKLNGPEEIKILASPEAVISAVQDLTGASRKDVIRQMVFLNLWTWWPTRGWAALHIRGVNPKEEGIRDEVVAFMNEKFDMSKDLHAILCCKSTCFVVEFPTVFAAKYDLRSFSLHRDGGNAIEYSDGTGFAWLNSVEVPSWVACTPRGELDVKKIMALSNVDARREGLARVSPDRMVRELDMSTIHSAKMGPEEWLAFEVVTVDLKDGKKRLLLKMFDPSSHKHCFERVEDDCETVEASLAWRDDEDEYVTPVKRT